MLPDSSGKIRHFKRYTDLSHEGNEVAFGTIGDASTAEGHFFETINAAGSIADSGRNGRLG